MTTIDDNNALLLYRVGPVLCCSPCLPISAVIEPPPLTRPPGTSSGRPGIFKHAKVIVSSLDLRFKFGVEKTHWAKPGRTIITQLDKNHIGFYVDEVLDVISMPISGWSALPALLPRGIFTRTLLFKERIYLYADFNDLQRIPDNGYLRQYIQHLLEQDQRKQPTQAANHAGAGSNTTVQHTVPPTSINPAEQKHTHPTVNHKPAVSAQTPTPPPSLLGTTSRTTFASRDKTASRRQTVQPNKPASIKATPSTNPVSAPPVDVPLTPLTKPVTAISLDKPPSAATPSSTVHTGTQSSNKHLLILLAFVLVFATSGLGLWYVLRDDARHVTHQLALAPKQSIAPTPRVPVPAPTPAAAPPPVNNAASVHDAAPVTTTLSKPSATASEYHASIEQDPHGLTITLDVPADDPVFAQTPPVTLHNPDAAPAPAAVAEVGAKKDPRVIAEAASPAATAPQSVEIIHLVVKGDTLWDIAKRYVNNPFRYPELARLSKIHNPDRIYPGNRVRIIKRKRQP